MRCVEPKHVGRAYDFYLFTLLLRTLGTFRYDTTGAGIAFPYPFGYPIVNKVLVDWAKSSSHVVISTKTEAKLARLILQDFVKVCITWLDPHLRLV